MLDVAHRERSDAQELADLLDLAERIQASYEASSRRKGVFRLLQLTVAVGCVGSLLYGLVAAQATAVWAISSAVLAGYTIGIDVMFVRRTRRQGLRDRYAMKQVLDLVRELEGVTALDENWTPLQRAEFRIRLSRFEIEEAEHSLGRR
jgi:hypothetical protein